MKNGGVRKTMMGMFTDEDALLLPSQPEIETGTAYYMAQSHMLQDQKTKLLFYQFRLKKGTPPHIRVLPDGCIDMLFSIGEANFSKMYGSVPALKTIMLPGSGQYFGVRLPLGTVVSGRNLSMKEIFNHEYELDGNFSCASCLSERLNEAQSFSERIHLFIESFEEYIQSYDSSRNVVGYALQKICACKGKCSISGLAEETGYSERYLRQKFCEALGFTPKHLCEVIRFRYVLLQLKQACPVNDIIFEAGYYDQAHFIKEFKKFYKQTPLQAANRLHLFSGI
ncbi:helix-turn-helix domain-containing protein [Heyndrickxia coagulans]|uniref:helix-turn-helix domain-containing protein n=1 Tax=Heyndrickxia coagulans TaxID=1398 RepID=UPI000E493934|nr:helix-turn-helix domain-containing protein [Heyndrickxia coagulans]RGR84985.1 AraC family transcriptional regulator [Heyndrickxia coagulans]RGR98219.1 AraC family transcriptional regulator [Heyndrickxia coagulans]